MTEAAFIKDDLGPVLAKGLAAVAVARPHDPVEYLALWMLHHVQQRERKAQEAQRAKGIEAQREEWAKGRTQREKAATAVIQREWKAHVRAVEDAKLKEAALREAFAKIDEIAEEKIPDEHAGGGGEGGEGGTGEAELAAEQERLNAQVAFQRARLYVQELDKSHIADFKRVNGNANTSAAITLRCVFYAMGLRPRQVESWEKVRQLIKPYAFAEWLHRYDPCGAPLERLRPLTRVRRLLTLVSDEEVRADGGALHAVYQWLAAAVAFRHARDEHIRAKRAAGREVEEELDEEEEAEDEEKDADEQTIREREAAEEAQRLAEEEAEREANEDGDGDGAADE